MNPEKQRRKSQLADEAENALRKLKPELFLEEKTPPNERLSAALQFCRFRTRETELACGVAGHIYFIACLQFVKVGVAINPIQRLGELQVGNPFPLTLLGSIPSLTPYEDEARIQAILAPYHIRGEWFSLAPDIIGKFLH